MARLTITESDTVKDALLTKVENNFDDSYDDQTELQAARDGEDSLLEKQDAQDALITGLAASIAALTVGTGCPVSSNDTTPGYLNGKLRAGDGIDLTEGSDGGDETLTIAAETGLNQATEFIPIEWAEDGTSAPDTVTLVTHTNGNVRVRKFAGDSSQDVIIPWRVPTHIVTADGLKFEVCCVVTESTGPSAEGVSFKLSGYSAGDGDDITGTFGTEVESKKNPMTYAQYKTFDTVLSGKVTVTNLAAGELVMLKLYRDHDGEDDTYEQKIGVYGMVLTYERV